MQPWDLQCVGTESGLCWEGRPPDPRLPSTCSLLPIPPPHPRPRILHEGRDDVSSIRLDLEWCGKAQGNRVALQVGGVCLRIDTAITCYPHEQGSLLPLRSTLHPYPPCFMSREAALSGLYQLGSLVFRFPDGFAQSEVPTGDPWAGVERVGIYFHSIEQVGIYSLAASLWG